MANIKISELNPLLTVEDADVLPIVDNGVTKKVTAAILQSYTQGNSVLLTGAQTVAGIKTFTSQLASSVATGTAPFSVASTTKVTNLNADLLDGLSSADFQATLSGTGIVKSTAGTISYLTDNTANWDSAYNDKINSAAVTGSGTNTLTLTQQDAGTITATWVNGTLIREVRNTTGATLTKGTIVYISGATGNKPTVTKAIATGDSTSAQTFGFIQSDLANNDNGYVVVVGDLTGVDTSAFAEGDQLYLSSTVAGAFTDVKQYAPAHLVYVGIVTRSHPTLGQIEVNIQNGYELDELHNVSAQSPSNGDILQFVTSTGLWTKVAGTTTNISEGTNLYFTNARSRSAISLTTTGTSGAATYNSTTGVLNVPNYADGGITSLNGLTALSQTFAVGTSGTDFGISSATSTHTFNLPTASATNRGALSSADWTTFNNKANTADLANYLPLAGGTLTGALNGTSSVFSSNVTANGFISQGIPNGLKIIGPVGGPAYGVTDQSVNNSGKAWRFGHTGAIGGFGSFDFYNQTDDITALTLASTGAATFSSSVTANGTLTVNEDGASTKIITIRSNWAGVDPAINVTTNNSLLLMTNNTEQMRITSAGLVGIGTASPTRTLSVNGQIGLSDDLISTNSTNVARFGYNAYYSSSGFNLTTENSIPLTFGTASAERMRIFSDGNIAINSTTNAGYKLDVNGTARVSGVLTINNGNTNYQYSGSNYYATGLGFSSNYNYSIYNTNYGREDLKIEQATGAATFSSSVTAGGSVIVGTTALLNFGPTTNFVGMSGNNSSGRLDLYANNAQVLNFAAGTGVATFTNQVNIGNPVTAAVAVASTHKVEIVIGGTTYYLLATT